MKKYSVFILLVFMVAGSCKQKDKNAAVINDQPDKFINPPIKGVVVPYSEYSVNAATGDTLTHPTGSVLVFPPNSFVDETGKVVTGFVHVKYRKFTDPVDFLLAGVPMQYDSAGKTYPFVSSEMIELLADKDGKPVFVNQKSKPQVHPNSSNSVAGYGVYRLDTVQKNWIYKGGMTFIEPDEQAKSGNSSETIDNTAIDAPVSAKANRALYVKDSIQNKRIEIENEKTAQLNKLIEKKNEAKARQNEITRREKERINAQKELDTAVSIFYVDGFGFWNCNMAKAFNFHYLIATFKTEEGEPLNFQYLALYVRGVNGCISTKPDHLSVKLGADNMILGVYKNRFAYVSFKEFKKLNITADTKAQTFIMKVVAEKDNNYEFIKRDLFHASLQ